MFTVIDIETTGLSKYYHKITEIAAARVRDGKVVRTFETLVNPEVPIPSFITRLTGIDDALVEDAPRVQEVLPAFQKFLSDDIFVAHNATFDFGFLDFNLKKHHGFALMNQRLCTRKLAYRLLPDLSQRRLQDLCSYFSVQNSQAHRAMGDVEATVQVLVNMLDLLEKKGYATAADVIRFEKSVRKDAKPVECKPYPQHQDKVPYRPPSRQW